jgi:cytosine/adenosine deaminase-related metal-dependent hydrolase
MVNIQPSKDFAQQLVNLWWRLDRALDEGITRSSGLVGAAEAVMGGVTSVVDHHASPAFIDGSLDVLKEGFETVGLRGVLCYEATDRNGADGAAAGVAENLRFAKAVDAARARGKDPLVEAAIGAHAPFTVDERRPLPTWQESANHRTGPAYPCGRGQVRRRGFPVPLRQGHSRAAGRGRAPGPKTILGHGLYLSREEVDLVNERDCFLAHNARSNMNNNVGYNSQLPLYRNAVLGTDGIGSDMIMEANFAFFKHHDAGGTLWMDAFLKMLQDGNRLLERYFPGKKFGRVEAGYEADLAFWDYDPPTPLLGDNVAGHAAFGLSSRMVRSTMVAAGSP